MNLSPEEHYRLHGRIADCHAIELLNAYVKIKAVADIGEYLDESKGGFPSKDFISDVIEDVSQLRAHVRGENKKDLQSILDKLNKLAKTHRQSSEYSLKQLKLAEKIIGSL